MTYSFNLTFKNFASYM